MRANIAAALSLLCKEQSCRQLTGKIPSDCCLTLPLLITNEEENQTRKKLRRCDLLRSAAATVCAL